MANINREGNGRGEEERENRGQEGGHRERKEEE